MARTPESCHGRLRPLIELALREGWIFCSDEGGWKLVKPGLPPILIGAPRGSPEDQRDRGERNG
jgi:hypothetical protein